jgi:hypothetical protein
VVAALLQTSQQLQAAVAQLLPGQLPVVLHARKLQQVTSFAQWLQKHGGLLRDVAVHVAGGVDIVHAHNKHGWRPAAVAALTAALQQAAAVGPLPLRSFTLKGALATPDLLQQLPAMHLTQLNAEVQLGCRDSRNAVQALSNLHSLTLYDHTAVCAARDMLHLLAAGLQQLTQLRFGMNTPAQLCYLAAKLPPQLQHVHVVVATIPNAQQLELLGTWLKHYGHILSTLQLYNTCTAGPGWESAWSSVGSAIQEAATAAAAAAAAAGSAPAASSAAAATSSCSNKSWQLQSFNASVANDMPGAALTQLLQYAPAHSLTELGCYLTRPGKAQVLELCRLTALRSLQLGLGSTTCGRQPDDLLAPLSGLQQLTTLELRGAVHRVQLQHLQLPRLQRLHALLSRITTNRVGQLQLGHLAAVTQLFFRVSEDWFVPAEQLPPNLQLLTLHYYSPRHNRSDGSSYSLQPLLALSRLQKLQLCMRDGVLAAEELARLSSISSLREVELWYNWQEDYIGQHGSPTRPAESAGARFDAAAEAAAAPWLALPLKALSWSSRYIPAAVVLQVSALQGLTRLELHITTEYAAEEMVPLKLAAMLRPLTGLQQLKLTSSTAEEYYSDGHRRVGGGAAADGFAGYDACAVMELLRVIGGLQELGDVNVKLQMHLSVREVDEVYEAAQELLPDWMVHICEVDTSSSSCYPIKP